MHVTSGKRLARAAARGARALALALAFTLAACGGSSSVGGAGSSVSIDKIVNGNGDACAVVTDAQITAAIGPITVPGHHPQTPADCEWQSAQYTADLAFADPNWWPPALTGDYSITRSPSPCPNDPGGVYGSTVQNATAAFCSTNHYGVQFKIHSGSLGGNDGDPQIKGVYDVTLSILTRYP